MPRTAKAAAKPAAKKPAPKKPAPPPVPANADPEDLLAEDMGRFFADPLGFVMYAFEWGTGDLVGFDGPDQWQRETLEAIGAEVGRRNFDALNPEPVDPLRMATASGHGIGKSALTAWLILWILSTRPHAKGVVTANTADQLATKTWAELAKWHRRCITGHWFDVTTGKGAMKIVHKEFADSWRCDAQTCKEENSESFAGLHAANSTPFYIFDEASAIPERIWEVAEGGQTDGEPMWFAFGNPTRNTGRFFEAFHRQRHRWICRQIDSRSARLPNKKLIAEWVADYGEDSDFVRVRVRGVFPRAGSTQFIGGDLVDAAMSPRREEPGSKHDALVLGVDIARFGDDQTVFYRRRGRDGRSWPLLKFRGLDTQQVASRIAELVEQHRIMGQSLHAIFLDEGGVGGGVIDRCRALNIPVVGVNFGARATDERKYSNRRAEMWGRMKGWLEFGAIHEDAELRADLTGPEYWFDNAERIVLESKRDMKARGLASPDAGDALALTFAQHVEVPTGGFTVGLGQAGRAVTDYDPFA